MLALLFFGLAAVCPFLMEHANAATLTTVGKSTFKRTCDTVCVQVSSWSKTLTDARESCADSLECVGVVDHSANGGIFGLCNRGADVVRGSADPLRPPAPTKNAAAICVEHKLSHDAVSFLQVAVAESHSTGGARAARQEWERTCNMYCDANSDKFPSFDTMEEAKFDCANRPDCMGLVDHTVHKGRVGMCDKSAKFAVGTDHAEAFARVCVERKPREPSVLLQSGNGERGSADSSKWEEVHDMMCDGAQEWEEDLESAKMTCLQKPDCAGVMDHSSTSGKFALCDSSMPLKQASSIFGGWKSLSVHVKH